MPGEEYAAVLVTAENAGQARRITDALLSARLAACVNIVCDIRSIYEWEGEIHDDQEFLLIIKTPKTHVRKLKKFIDKHHSYEVPEFVAFEVSDALPEYLKWAYEVTS